MDKKLKKRMRVIQLISVVNIIVTVIVLLRRYIF